MNELEILKSQNKKLLGALIRVVGSSDKEELLKMKELIPTIAPKNEAENINNAIDVILEII